MLESKRRAIIFLLLSLLLAIIAGFLVLQKVKALNNDLGTVVNVYAAKSDIASRQDITPDLITTKEIPKKYLENYHITNISDLENKVAVVPLSAGDVISKNVLKQSSVVMEEHNRLISVMSDERVFFDESLEALDRVDIIVSEKFGDKPKTTIFMKDVKVARIAKKSDKFAGVQLEVPLEQAPQLIHMQNYADSVRIVKSNVGQPAEELEEAGKEDKEVKQAETEKASAKEEKEETKDKKDDSNEAKDKKDE
ncbi:flp pilus assembly protein CpaB [Bacillus sp. FJAT-27916]|uniref:SAF domain-containing protein n=1 Tax=Bacillus sp. FJAT-27916 TaxID=1679169 RepID=UPI0006707782|nr:SAF domain-containing protein [Bacillus sp. FJAT-27916]KMY45944.1 flp pilus assembly protein CpaB [Bacillus sp. FJAT-27916]